ncbi:MAG: DUF378 domain-containing protein [Burkholderiaceae bacterium]
MKAMNILTLILLIIGGLNWGLVGLFQFDLVAAISGGQTAVLARVVYVIVGLSALWQIIPLVRASGSGEVYAQKAR